MIIDIHAHLFVPALQSSRDFYLSDPHFSLLYRDEKSRMVSHVELIASMDEASVDVSVAMGFPWVEEAPAREQNEYFSSVAKQHGQRIIPFGTVSLSEKTIKERVREIKALGLGGIGEVGFYQSGFDNSGEVYLRQLMEGAAEEGLPICLHVNEPVGHPYPGKYDPNFERLYQLISDFPDVKIIMAHWGGGLPFYELMGEVKEAFRNVCYDTAASPFLYDPKIYTVVADIVGEDKILFGSDFPLISFARYRDEIEGAVENTSLRKKILGENAAKFLGLE